MQYVIQLAQSIAQDFESQVASLSPSQTPVSTHYKLYWNQDNDTVSAITIGHPEKSQERLKQILDQIIKDHEKKEDIRELINKMNSAEKQSITIKNPQGKQLIAFIATHAVPTLYLSISDGNILIHTHKHHQEKTDNFLRLLVHYNCDNGSEKIKNG